MLLALLSWQRCETLHALDINGMQLSSVKCVFTIRTLLKTIRVHHLTPIKLLAVKHDPAFCIVTHLERSYIDRTRTLRGLTKLNCRQVFKKHINIIFAC